MTRRHTFDALLLLFGISAPVWAQGAFAPVSGRVVAADSAPLPGALVEVLGVADSVRTSVAGDFRFARIPTGKQTLRIRALGYGIKQLEIMVARDSGWTGTILLEASVVVLPEVAVSSPIDKPEAYAHTARYDDFFRRRKLGIGTFRTRQDIEEKAAYDLVSVLQGIPSVGVSQTKNPNNETEVRFRLARCTPPQIGFYIDGRKVGSYRTVASKSSCDDCARLAEAMSSVLLRDIEFVEFYRGPSQIPPELDRGNICAALVVWTR